MCPSKELPYSKGHKDANAYVEGLLKFVTSTNIFQVLCGGVHILDFFTKDPELYETVLPIEWREWLDHVNIPDLLSFLMHDKIDTGFASHDSVDPIRQDRPSPPQSLVEYVLAVRHFSLERAFSPPKDVSPKLSRSLSVGMKPKKAHEVENLATFIDRLTIDLEKETSYRISHLVDFGSGQNYLGRVLASPRHERQVIAIESKQLNIDGAKSMDILAKVVKKNVVMRNKKQYRHVDPNSDVHPDASVKTTDLDLTKEEAFAAHAVQYIAHELSDGELSKVISCIEHDPQMLVMSLHSCGNLIHHGIRSLILNEAVKAVVLVGCCYNLCTERLGPPTYKLPNLRSPNKRLEHTSAAYDPHGFPMSERFATYEHHRCHGIRFNITARMMAVQAPRNWTQEDCNSFFTRHFYRALLQRIFLDRGFVDKPRDIAENIDGCSLNIGGRGEPIIIGSLRKSCYTSFVAYVRGAIAKLSEIGKRVEELEERMSGLTDKQIEDYETRYIGKKHQLCILWGLMAFSASVVESAFVVDRWLYLTEQPEVESAWVQTVFDYKYSPRNLAVIGIKKDMG